jgi:hypothetical protein
MQSNDDLALVQNGKIYYFSCEPSRKQITLQRAMDFVEKFKPQFGHDNYLF